MLYLLISFIVTFANYTTIFSLLQYIDVKKYKQQLKQLN